MSPFDLFELSNAALLLGIEAQNVVALRVAKLAGGGGEAEREARRMVEEKPAAFIEAQFAAVAAIFGGSPERATSKAIAVYRRHVRANRRRLSRRG